MYNYYMIILIGSVEHYFIEIIRNNVKYKIIVLLTSEHKSEDWRKIKIINIYRIEKKVTIAKVASKLPYFKRQYKINFFKRASLIKNKLLPKINCS